MHQSKRLQTALMVCSLQLRGDLSAGALLVGQSTCSSVWIDRTCLCAALFFTSKYNRTGCGVAKFRRLVFRGQHSGSSTRTLKGTKCAAKASEAQNTTHVVERYTLLLLCPATGNSAENIRTLQQKENTCVMSATTAVARTRRATICIRTGYQRMRVLFPPTLVRRSETRSLRQRLGVVLSPSYSWQCDPCPLPEMNLIVLHQCRGVCKN